MRLTNRAISCPDRFSAAPHISPSPAPHTTTQMHSRLLELGLCGCGLDPHTCAENLPSLQPRGLLHLATGSQCHMLAQRVRASCGFIRFHTVHTVHTVTYWLYTGASFQTDPYYFELVHGTGSYEYHFALLHTWTRLFRRNAIASSSSFAMLRRAW